MSSSAPEPRRAPDRVVATAPSRPERSRYQGRVQHDLRGYVLRRLLILVDAAALVVAFVVGMAVQVTVSSDLPLSLIALAALVAGAPFWVLIAHLAGLYHVDARRMDHSVSEEVVPVTLVTTLWAWLALLLTAATAEEVRLPQLAALWGASIGVVLTFRWLARAWARRQDWYRQTALLVTSDGGDAAMILSRLGRHPEYGVDVVAVVSERGSGAESLEAIPVFASDDNLIDLVDALAVDRVIVIWPRSHAGERAPQLVELAESGVHVDVVPGDMEVLGANAELYHLDGLPLITLPYTALPTSAFVLKRMLDLSVAIPALVVLCPVFLYFGLRIKRESPGPVLFRQERIGRGGQTFTMLKLRTMHTDADGMKHEVEQHSVYATSGGPRMFKIRSDPRTTSFGRRLRRYSLDELPQLWNVVKGEMSLVGPRPLIASEALQVTGHYSRRSSLTPGLTGLWQVSGRSDIPFEDMIRLDYLYVTSWSLGGDFKLLLRTIAAVGRGRGAY